MSAPPSETLAALDRAIQKVSPYDGHAGDIALLQALRDGLAKKLSEKTQSTFPTQHLSADCPPYTLGS